jgi:hypothetical protein
MEHLADRCPSGRPFWVAPVDNYGAASEGLRCDSGLWNAADGDGDARGLEGGIGASSENEERRGEKLRHRDGYVIQRRVRNIVVISFNTAATRNYLTRLMRTVKYFWTHQGHLNSPHK